MFGSVVFDEFLILCLGGYLINGDFLRCLLSILIFDFFFVFNNDVGIFSFNEYGRNIWIGFFNV